MIFIIDGNHFFNRSVFTAVNFDNKKTKFLSTEKDQEIFIRKVVIDIFSKVKLLKPSGIIFTFDGKSWRKDLPNLNPKVSSKIQDKLDFSYKDKRSSAVEEDSKIDWSVFYKLIDEFIQILSEKGYLAIKRYGLEGDDVCYLLGDKILEMGEDGIIISADGDMRVLAKTNDKNYLIAFNPVVKDKGLYVPKNFENWMQSRDSNATIMDFSIETNPLHKFRPDEVVEIDPLKMCFSKVFLGKSNESVPSIYTWKNKNNDDRNLTERFVGFIYNKVLEKIPNFKMEDFEDEITRKYIAYSLLAIVHNKIKPEDHDDELIQKISDRILVNYYMKYLSLRTLPSNLIEDFNKIIIKTKTIRFGIDDILEGTRFSEKKTASGNIFDLLD